MGIWRRFSGALTFALGAITLALLLAPSSASAIGCGGTTYIAPTAEFTSSPASPYAEQAVSFNASGSSSGWRLRFYPVGLECEVEETELPITELEWVFGDGTTQTTTSDEVVHHFAAAGIYTVQLTVRDGAPSHSSASTSHEVTIVAPAVPECQEVTATAAANTAKQVSLTCTTPPEVATTYSIVEQPTHGALSNLEASTGTVTYTPDTGYSGPDTFTYKATNAGGESEVKPVNVSVEPPPKPTCQPVAHSVAGGGQASIALNCSSTTGFANTYAIVGQPGHGALSNFEASTGSVTYTPEAGYVGPDTFTYKATNAGGESAIALVSVTVEPPPKPVCQAVTQTTPGGTAVRIAFNCSSTAGFANLYGVVATPAHGSISALDAAAGAVTYTPDPGYVGVDSFTYRAGNSGGDSSAATVSITVGPPPVPVCEAVAVSTEAGAAASITLSCPGAPGFANTYAVVSGPGHGSLNGLDPATGALTYAPAAGYTGPDSFTFRAANAGGDSNVATVSITVKPHAGGEKGGEHHAAFALGALKLNPKKGTATLAVEAFVPGTAKLSGKSVKTVSATAAGGATVVLTIKPTGKLRRKLAKSGRARVTISVTFTPAGGTASTQTKLVKLKLTRRH